MLSFLKKLTGNEKKEQTLLQAISRNALIVDVRTENEFNGGHIPGSKNIPLNKIVSKAGEFIHSGKPVIVCCASGMRSSQAAAVLSSKGVEIYNGGSWVSLQRLIQPNS